MCNKNQTYIRIEIIGIGVNLVHQENKNQTILGLKLTNDSLVSLNDL